MASKPKEVRHNNRYNCAFHALGPRENEALVTWQDSEGYPLLERILALDDALARRWLDGRVARHKRNVRRKQRSMGRRG